MDNIPTNNNNNDKNSVRCNQIYSNGSCVAKLYHSMGYHPFIHYTKTTQCG